MPDIRISEINAGAKEAPASFILQAEECYKEKIRNVADRLVAKKNHILFIAGPSGSGKTTTASLIADELSARGREAFVISLDDFYKDAASPDYPRNPDGELDFESVYALDLDFIESTLIDVAENRRFSVPSFDFSTSSRREVRVHDPIGEGIVIIEGLHALNPLISQHLPKGAAMRLFISLSTNIIAEDGERIISGRKLRFIRRMVRDSIYRATSPSETVRLWSGVRRGEDEYLYPTRIYADLELDTFHAYELSLMRPFVESLVTPDMAEESEYMRVALEAVGRAYPIDIGMLPKDSLLREFVPAT